MTDNRWKRKWPSPTSWPETAPCSRGPVQAKIHCGNQRKGTLPLHVSRSLYWPENVRRRKVDVFVRSSCRRQHSSRKAILTAKLNSETPIRLNEEITYPGSPKQRIRFVNLDHGWYLVGPVSLIYTIGICKTVQYRKMRWLAVRCGYK